MTVNAMTEQPSPAEALPDVLMRIVSELHDVAYLIERIEPQLLGRRRWRRTAELAGKHESDAGH